MQEVPLVDGHNDLPWAIRSKGSSFEKYNISKRLTFGCTDIPRLREGRIGAQFWSVWVPTRLLPKEAVKTTREQILLVKNMCQKFHETFEMAYTSEDIWKAFKAGKIASLIGMEGGHSINSSLETLREFYQMGVRYMTLTHSQNVPWADSATDTPKYNGLNAFGRQVIKEMNQLGMMIDLSHVSPETMRDAITVSKAPVIFSHSSAYELCKHPRNVPDNILELVKTNRGVVMVTWVPEYVSQPLLDYRTQKNSKLKELNALGLKKDSINQTMESWEQKNPAPKATLQDVVNHIDYIKQKIGVDFVGIGSDFDGGGTVQGLEDVSKFPDLIVELLKREYRDDEIKKIMGLNLLRVMKQCEIISRQLQINVTETMFHLVALFRKMSFTC
jgi:membrane dipeptidase